jgi:phosphoglycerate dehydrogenase-like enzyme
MSEVEVLSLIGPIPGVADMVDGVALTPIPSTGPIDPNVTGEVLLTLMTGSPNLPEVLERGVRWVHAIGTGVDAFPTELLGDRVLTCSRGVNATNVAEWVFAQMLSLEKRLPAAWVSSPPVQWGQPELGSLAGETLAVVGFGSIGQAIARRAVAFEIRVRAMRRRSLPSGLDGVEMVTSVAELVGDADHVVLAAPATAATRGMVDRAFLQQMKEGAHLINVARPDLIDEDALREALDSGHLGCASIDVSAPEPLPDGHWFYTHPKVRFSPHVSWSGPGLWDATLGLFTANLRRWRDGEPLEGVVDLQEGY